MGSILLGLFLVAQIVLAAGRLLPNTGLGLEGAVQGPQWVPVVPGRARVSLRTASALVVTTGSEKYWRVSLAGQPGALALKVLRVPQVLPGGTLVTVDMARLDGRLRIVGVGGAPAWLDPDGRAVAVFDVADRALWALMATDPRPHPLGPEDPDAPGALVWSETGDRLTYLSGRPARLWSWQVGSYARSMGPAAGTPLAVRPDGTTVVALTGGTPGIFLPNVRGAVPVASAHVVSAAPDGREAVVGVGNRLYMMDLDTAMALLLPVPARDATGDVVWDANGDVALLAREAGGTDNVVVASLASRSVDTVPLPAGLRPAQHGLVAVGGGRIIMTFEVKGSPVTYMMVPGQSA